MSKPSDKDSTAEDLGFRLVSIYDIFPWLREDKSHEDEDLEDSDNENADGIVKAFKEHYKVDNIEEGVNE